MNQLQNKIETIKERIKLLELEGLINSNFKIYSPFEEMVDNSLNATINNKQEMVATVVVGNHSIFIYSIEKFNVEITPMKKAK